MMCKKLVSEQMTPEIFMNSRCVFRRENNEWNENGRTIRVMVFTFFDSLAIIGTLSVTEKHNNIGLTAPMKCLRSISIHIGHCDKFQEI